MHFIRSVWLQVALDNSMLNPVSQLSMAIRENTEQLTEKIKYVNLKFDYTSDEQEHVW